MVANTIYILRNLLNNKVYVGQTWKKLDKRANYDGRGYDKCSYLWNAIKKYGWKNFRYEKLDFAFTQGQADLLEIFYIFKYDSYNPQSGYNIRNGGSRGQHGEETKNKMSIAAKGKAKSLQHIQNMSKTFFKTGHIPWNKNKNLSEKTKKEISKNSKGKHFGEQHPGAKLTEINVLEIRKLYKNRDTSYSKLAKTYSVSKVTIANIIKNKIWTHI